MIKLPSGVDINNLIDDMRIISWQAADILLYYSKLLEDSDDKKNILKNNNEDDPVTLADLKVNEIIIKNINEKYKNIHWDILSEENVKISPKHKINTIKVIFKSIGAAEPIANLLKEFKTPVYKETKEIKNK